MLKKVRNSNFVIKWTHWEYWPIWMAYLPVLPLILFYALRSRKFFFFSNVNPLFKTGALMGASKYQILSQIPQQFIPKTFFVSKHNNDLESVLFQIQKNKLEFPIIVKPDIGERGLLVALINNENELQSYLNANKIDLIVQEYINFENECGIFYVRKPSEKRGRIVSVGLKDFLRIKGDGKSTVKEIMLMNQRSKLQIPRMEQSQDPLLHKVLQLGETITLEPIGNHNRGTCFINGNHLISEKLDSLFNQINDEMEEVYYGRFDIKYNTWEKLLEGEDLKILEMNGVASEPIHVYDATVRIRDKYKSFYGLWRTIYEISNIQKQRGIQPIDIKTAFATFKEYKSYIKSINVNWKVS